MPNPTCAIETITPDMAKQWLDINHRNRRLNDPTVRRLAGIIRRGEWMESSTDAIGLDTDGGVVNGQHRLTAIIDADTPIRALVVRNVDPDVIKVIDQGLHRNLAQLLMMDGRWPNPTILASAAEWIYKICNGYEARMPADQKATVPQLLELFPEAHPRLVESLEAGAAVFSKLRVDRAMLVAYHYTMASVDPDLADNFFTQLASGLDISEGAPVGALREKYVAEMSKPAEKKERKYVLVALLVKAWEATRQGETLNSRQLKWVHSGARAEAFPKVTDVPWMPVDEDTIEQ